jgi:hypothetical protein
MFHSPPRNPAQALPELHTEQDQAQKGDETPFYCWDCTQKLKMGTRGIKHGVCVRCGAQGMVFSDKKKS